MTSLPFLPMHVGHHAMTLASAAVVLALLVMAVVVAVVVDRWAAPSEVPDSTATKETRP